MKQLFTACLLAGATLTAAAAPLGNGRVSMAPQVRLGETRSSLPEGYVLYESFEDWDGADINWTPDGWSVEMKGNVDREDSWTPEASDPYGISAPDGKFMYAINYSEGEQDEWLISPFVEVPGKMDLSYWLWFTPSYLFTLENVDWDTMEWVGDPIVAANLQVYVQPEGEKWILLRDYAEEYKDMDLEEMLMIYPTALEQHNISLAEYAGKTLRVAFRYYGSDGNTMYIDAIGIGVPNLDDLSYINPYETLYWGFDRTPELGALQAGIAFYPVYAPITWTNMSDYDDVEYSWRYTDPETHQEATLVDSEELSLMYAPDYSTPQTTKNNFVAPPVLEATTEDGGFGNYQASYSYFQAGGKPEITFNDGTDFEVSLFPFDIYESGIGITTVEDDQIGDMGIPVFGYNKNVDQYWLNYTLNGAEPMEGDYSHLIGIGNLFMPSEEAPLVVNGITVYGYGKIADDAELTATIYGLDSDWSADYESLTPIASATIKGSDILAMDENQKSYLCLPFDFAEPAVVKATDEHPAYFFMFEGFNSDKVEYFAPLQSTKPDPNYLCWGYMLNHIDVSQQTGRPPYYSLKPMVYKEDDEYVDPYAAFAIGLNAVYPWLTTEVEEIVLDEEQCLYGEIPLSSYYDGRELEIEWEGPLECWAEGRYNECVLSVYIPMPTRSGQIEGECDVTIKAPGVELTIPVKYSFYYGGVDDITIGDANVAAIYDLSGRRIESATEAGIYVVKFDNGTTRKLIKK